MLASPRQLKIFLCPYGAGHSHSAYGHKAAIVVDTDTQLITAVEVLPGNAPDNLGALELVEQSEANTGVPVQEAMGDAAYGDGATRQTFADAGRTLIARVPGRPDRQRFPKNDFVIDLVAGSCTCPAGQVTHTIVPAGRRTDAAGRIHHLQAFQKGSSESSGQFTSSGNARSVALSVRRNFR